MNVIEEESLIEIIQESAEEPVREMIEEVEKQTVIEEETEQFVVKEKNMEEMEQNNRIPIVEKEQVNKTIEVFQPSQELLLLSKQMEAIPEISAIANEVELLAYNGYLVKKDFEVILKNLGDQIKLVKDKGKSLKDPIERIYDSQKDCADISKYTFSTLSGTYETFLETEDFNYILKEMELLNSFQQVIPYIFEEEEKKIDELFLNFCDISHFLRKQ